MVNEFGLVGKGRGDRNAGNCSCEVAQLDVSRMCDIDNNAERLISDSPHEPLRRRKRSARVRSFCVLHAGK
jgi:hypothetical protein